MIGYREATPADLATICALGNEVNAVHHNAWPQIFAAEAAAERDREFWSKSIGGPNDTAFVAEDENQVVGFVTVSVVREASSLLQPIVYGRIGSVSVTATKRSAGIGRALVAEASRRSQGK